MMERTLFQFLPKSCACLSINEKRMLLMMENEEKLRPLELAAQMQEFELQMAILKTREVYSFFQGELWNVRADFV